MTDETSQKSPLGKWIPVIAVVVAVAIIGIYYVAVYIPAQVPAAVPENSDEVTADPVHTVTWQNKCGYPVWVDILGGTLYYPNPGNTQVKYSACQQLPDGTCVPNTRCDGVAHGSGNVNTCTRGDPMVDGGGFKLEAGTPDAPGTHTSTLQKSWQGAFWGRTGCVDDGAGSLTCDVGDCKVYQTGKGKVQCGGQGPFGPYKLTKGEFNLNELGSAVDYYDVSLVDGYNIPMRIELKPGSFSNGANTNKDYDCTISEANTDLLPLFKDSKLSTSKIGGYLSDSLVSIKSACEYAKENDNQNINKYCCLGEYGPGKCNPDTWPAEIRTAPFFKQYNPKAYSYAYNDASSTYMCRNKDATTLTSYIVTFCPGQAAGAATIPAGVVQTTAAQIPAPVVTTVPTMTPVLTQTAVPSGPYNPSSSGGANF